MSKNQENIDKMKSMMQDLTKDSSTLCLAKWFQSTIYLSTGHTHSCHHPRAHKIDSKTLISDPSGLHNTPEKIIARKDLKSSIQTPECEYCWNIENLGKDFISDRTYKSVDNWSHPFRQDIYKKDADSKILPTYLEVSFENSCNLKCIYCSPEISSRWMNEIEKEGPYHLYHNKLFHDKSELIKKNRWPIPPEEHNPFTEAFFRWWPDLKSSLNTFRITGGEPLLSKHTWRILEDIISNPQPHLSLAINTNLSVHDDQIDKFIEKINLISKNVKEFSIFTSCESTDQQNNYIRYGMDYSKFMFNVEKIIKNTPENIRINFMSTISSLALCSFPNFLRDLGDLRKKSNPNKQFLSEFNRLPLMISYVRDPNFLDVRVVSNEIKENFTKKIINLLALESNGISQNFYLEEIDQINRLCEYMNSPIENQAALMTDFYLYFKEIDKRRNQSFIETFPEFEGFYNFARKTAYKKMILDKISSK